MKLRWFQTYNENGLDSKPELQYWDKLSKRWETIPYLRVPFYLEKEYLEKKDAL